jgi:hypothetical protein
MTQKTDDIKSLVSQILSIKAEEVGPVDEAKLEDFLVSAVNGDEFDLSGSLVIPAQLSKDKSGVLVYVLTSAKLLKIQIDKEGFQSSSAFLNQIFSVDRSLTIEGRAAVEIKFGQESFGLRYSPKHEAITKFFTRVEEAVRPKKA